MNQLMKSAKTIPLLNHFNIYGLPCNRNINERSLKNYFDIVVIGGGIIGTATARELCLRHPDFQMAILEKESNVAKHQSLHNSGVIHAGIYYKPGSLKAHLCRQGSHLLYNYADANKIPYKKVGKLIVATDKSQLKDLDDLHHRALVNNVPNIELLPSQEIASIEPNCIGLKALWSPTTGIIHFSEVARSFARDFQCNGGEILLNFKVNSIDLGAHPEYPIEVNSTQNKRVRARYVITCGGLYSDKLAQMTKCSENPKIIPFRGEYLVYKGIGSSLVKTNIYPVPNPRMPFLGVHFTPRMDGSLWMGPNALLACAREGYTWSQINVIETIDIFKHKGFRKLAKKYFVEGVNEMMRSAFVRMQVKELQKFVPSLKVEQIERGPSGVRAQAIDANGAFINDFYFDSAADKQLAQRIVHCRNVPSPGATSSMAIARMIADKVENMRAQQ